METTDKKKYVNIKVIADKKFKTSSICLLLRRPLKRGEATLNALLANILGSGSKNYPNLYEINKYLEELYGAVFSIQIVKKGEYQIIRFYIEHIAQGDTMLMENSIEFLHEILFNPLLGNARFNEEIVATEKQMLKDSIENRINNKNEYARLKCIEKMCVEEPFGIFADGYAEDIDNLDSQTLYSHYRNILRQTPLEFVVTGNVDETAFTNAVEEIFVNKDYRPCLLKTPDIIYTPKEEQIFEEIQNINQGKICMGLRAKADFFGKDFYTLIVLNEVLGGGGNSRLFTSLREKDSLCYNIFSFVYRAKSILMIQCGVDSENIQQAITKIKEQIEEIKQNHVSAQEIDMAKKTLLSHFHSMGDYQGQIIDFYYTQYILSDDSNIEDMINGVENVQPFEIIEMAKSLYYDVIFTLKGEKNEAV